MFHWKLSKLSATGTTSGGTRLPIVVHHDSDVPVGYPQAGKPEEEGRRRQQLGRGNYNKERHRADKHDLRHEQHATPIVGVRRGTREHDGEDAGERAHGCGERDQNRRRRQALHDEAADERDHPDTGVGKQGCAL